MAIKFPTFSTGKAKVKNNLVLLMRVSSLNAFFKKNKPHTHTTVVCWPWGRGITDSIPTSNVFTKKILCIYLYFLQVYSLDLPGFCYFVHSPFGSNFHFSKESLELGVFFVGFFVTMPSSSLLYNHTVFTFPLFYFPTEYTLFLGVSNTMSLNHHKGLTLNYTLQCLFNKKQQNTTNPNQPMQQTNTLLFCSFSSVVLSFWEGVFWLLLPLQRC